MKRLSPTNQNSQPLNNVPDATANQQPFTKGQADTALALKTDKTTLAASGLGVVNHGSTASTARPSGYKQIFWVGTVAPTNAIAGDVWYEG